MQPPWSRFPDLPSRSVGWKLAAAREYCSEFRRWFSSLTEDEQNDYARDHPPPPGWKRLYARIKRTSRS
jgi:hypothetical protein